MTAVLHEARQPRQKRAKDRFEAVLAATRKLLDREGLSGFSIPAVAEMTGYTRASIYKFFPTPYAVLNELTRRHLAGLEAALVQKAGELRDLPWQDGVRAIVKYASAYHNAHPVGMKLVLGGTASDESHRSLEMTVHHLGALARQLLAVRGVEVPFTPVDAAGLAVDLGTTCFRQSYARHGRILPEYEDAAASVMIDYLGSHLSRG